MDDLLKRQNAAGQGGFDPNRADGGDLNGGDGLHPRPGESDVGSGLEPTESATCCCPRSWLNEQSQQPVESWLQSHGGQEISLDNFGEPGSTSDFTQSGAERSLVVVDTRSNQWEELSRDLPDNTDLLVLNDNRGGVDQLKDFLGGQGSDAAYSQISLIGSADADVISFGSLELDAAELGKLMSIIQQSICLLVMSIFISTQLRLLVRMLSRLHS